MQITEELDWTLITQGAALPSLLIDLEDSGGDDVDLSTGYDTFSAKLIRDSAVVDGVTPSVTGTATGFSVNWGVSDTSNLAAGEYLVQAKARRTIDQKYRYGKCLILVVTGF